MKKIITIMACIILIVMAFAVLIPANASGGQTSTAPGYPYMHFYYPQYMTIDSLTLTPTSVAPGGSVAVSFHTSRSYPNYYFLARMWIDWNGDKDFMDAGEQVYQGTVPYSTSINTNFNVNVPATATPGNTWARVAGQYGYYGYPAPTGGNYYYGGVEDRQLTISGGGGAVSADANGPYFGNEGTAIQFDASGSTGGGAGGSGDFNEDFEGSTSGWTTSGLWHITSYRSQSPSKSMAYNSESNHQYLGNTNGFLTKATSVDLSTATSPRLKFYSWQQTENGGGSGNYYDRRYVQVSTNNGASWSSLSWSGTNTLPQSYVKWYQYNFDLSAYASSTQFKVRFYFNSVDSVWNYYEGWYVDDVEITGLAGSGGGGGSGDYDEDFEGSLSDWTTSGLWHVTSYRSQSPTKSMAYNSESNHQYLGNTNGFLTKVASVDLSTATSPRLKFYSWQQTENGGGSGNYYDRRYVQVSTNNGASWSSLSWSGTNTLPQSYVKWYQYDFDLSAYASSTQFKVRFYFNSVDSVWNYYEGWYIDDVEITGLPSSGGGGSTDTDLAQVTVSNVAPTIAPIGPYTVNEGTPLALSATATDVGSDDLTFTWDFGDGTPAVTNTHYNNGVSPDPYPSTGPTFPFSATDTIQHSYGDNGVYRLTLTVTDDDGGQITSQTTVTVNNVAPTVTLDMYLYVDFTLRVAGEKWHNVEMYIYAGTSVIGYAEVVRYPGSPDDQAVTIADVKCDVTQMITPTCVYTPNDDPVNGQINGASPAWVIMTFDDDHEDKIDHTFNYNKPAEWVWGVTVNQYFMGHELTCDTTATDLGSDDLMFTLDWGDGTSPATATFYNDGLGPDPYPSPWGTFPFTESFSATHTYMSYGGFTLKLTVADDDSGSTTITVIVILM